MLVPRDTTAQRAAAAAELRRSASWGSVVAQQLWLRRWFLALVAGVVLCGVIVLLTWYFGIGNWRKPSLRDQLAGKWVTSENTWLEFKTDGTFDVQYYLVNIATGERKENTYTGQYRWLDDEQIEKKTSRRELLRATSVEVLIDWEKMDEKSKAELAGADIEKAKVVIEGENLSLLYDSGKVERLKRAK
jgi:hypothetical protein